MVLRSDGLCHNPIDWPQMAMQDQGLKPPEDALPCSRPRLKPQPDHVLKCPRCDSLNTKFCYYNNYSLLQPRYFCKTCRRYWTKGGALRNVPVGGGCRKNKRTKQRISSELQPSPSCHPNADAGAVSTSAASSMGGELGSESCTPLQPESFPGGASSLYYSQLASVRMEGGEEMSFPYSHARRLAEQTGLATSTSHLASLPPSTLASLSQQLSTLAALPRPNGFLHPDCSTAPGDQLRPVLGNLAGSAGDLNYFLKTHPHRAISPARVVNQGGIDAFPGLAADGFNPMDPTGHWKASHQAQKVALQKGGEGHSAQPHEFLMPLEINQSLRGSRHPQSRAGLENMSPCRKLEEPQSGDWQGQDRLFEPVPETNFWNNAAWPDLSRFNPSTGQLL